MKHLRLFFLGVMALGLITACSESTQNLEQQVDSLIAEQKFEEALELLEDQPASEEVTAQKEEVHLQYGIYLIYNADPSQMRENANEALRQFIAVLEINPDNEKAIAETEQILSIYRTFPNRQPEQEVLDKLQELGFQV
ncbi:hypothetical protein [Gracilimonas mengyeensis]|uniref:Tetratricopeptide repeat-containing protein n=1 Tax=Gracilimonas mengyeensis TaxID=1302730 RepID=A0A521BWB3_9BACT|nr:hypothetical protein [Gracilimonas mengyeensis]SMO50901.1 hypothetical protein SAMN06265219_103109 [Gracilimonas mengyeensis]